MVRIMVRTPHVPGVVKPAPLNHTPNMRGYVRTRARNMRAQWYAHQFSPVIYHRVSTIFMRARTPPLNHTRDSGLEPPPSGPM